MLYVSTKAEKFRLLLENKFVVQFVQDEDIAVIRHDFRNEVFESALDTQYRQPQSECQFLQKLRSVLKSTEVTLSVSAGRTE